MSLRTDKPCTVASPPHKRVLPFFYPGEGPARHENSPKLAQFDSQLSDPGGTVQSDAVPPFV